MRQLSLFPRHLPEIDPDCIGDENYTPIGIIEAVRNTLGEIDLDPASCEIAQKTVKANHYFNITDNGLGQDWTQYRTIWVNPPYSRGRIDKFVDKLIKTQNKVKIPAIILTNNSTETEWFQRLFHTSDVIAFPSKRLNFHNPYRERKQDSNRYAQAIFSINVDPKKFVDNFNILKINRKNYRSLICYTKI